MASAHARRPEWARKGSPLAPGARALRVLLRDRQLTTVCEEARCPNLGECFSRGTATFMLLGDRCTRRCGYCSVATGRPLGVDEAEPAGVAEAAGRPTVYTGVFVRSSFNAEAIYHRQPTDPA